jgi:hypothetical protein
MTRNKYTQEDIMAGKFYCKYCGQAFSSVQSLTQNWCTKNPAGKTGQPHDAAL